MTTWQLTDTSTLIDCEAPNLKKKVHMANACHSLASTAVSSLLAAIFDRKQKKIDIKPLNSVTVHLSTSTHKTQTRQFWCTFPKRMLAKTRLSELALATHMDAEMATCDTQIDVVSHRQTDLPAIIHSVKLKAKRNHFVSVFSETINHNRSTMHKTAPVHGSHTFCCIFCVSPLLALLCR